MVVNVCWVALCSTQPTRYAITHRHSAIAQGKRQKKEYFSLSFTFFNRVDFLERKLLTYFPQAVILVFEL